MADVAPQGVKEKRPWTQSTEFWSLLLGALATVVAVATFLGLQVEKHKRLELVYRAKLSFFNPDIHSSQKVSVLYDRRPITQLTKISAMIVNSGSIPIDKRDLERPSVLQFDDARARIIEAHIVQKNPSGLEATVTTQGNACTLGTDSSIQGIRLRSRSCSTGTPAGRCPRLTQESLGLNQ